MVDFLRITPRDGLVSTGFEGGPFSPSNIVYTLSNTGTDDLQWQVGHSESWSTLSSQSGVLSSGESTSVAVTINPAADGLLPESYIDMVEFVNLNSGMAFDRDIELTVQPIPGEIAVQDSIVPETDLDIPFGSQTVGGEITEQITITNGDGLHDLILSDITVGSVVEVMSQGLATVLPLVEPVVEAGTYAAAAGTVHSGRASETRYVPAGHLTSSVGLNVLFLAAGEDPTHLRATVLAFSDIETADYIDAALNTPSLTTLQGYDVVVLMANDWLADAIGLGDVLADYVDDGGRVVQSVATFSTDGGWELGGRFVAEDYGPFLHGSAEFQPHSLGTYDATHPIMQGIMTITDGLPTAVGLKPTATWVADWDNGTTLVAIQEPSGVVGINLFAFDSGNYTGDVGLLFHNAIVSVMETSFELGDLPALPVVVPPLGNLTFDVTYRPTGEGEHEAAIVIDSNDADEPRTIVTLSGHGAPDLLLITPETGHDFSGHPGGPFSPTNAIYELTNASSGDLDWSAFADTSWIDVIPGSGTLSSGETAVVTVLVAPSAALLGEDVYVGTVGFSNVTGRSSQSRDVSLTVFTAPELVVTPHFLDVTVPVGGIETQQVIVANGIECRR